MSVRITWPVVGQRFTNNAGQWYTIIEVNGALKIRIKFDEGFEKVTQKCNILSGSIRLPKYLPGMFVKDKIGNDVEIIKIFKGRSYARFRWEDGYTRDQQISCITLNTIMREEDSQTLNPAISIGKFFQTKAGHQFEVVAREDNGRFKIKFKSPVEYEQSVHGSNIISGSIANAFIPSHSGKGYLGLGRSGAESKVYRTWAGMLKRCYDYRPKAVTYHDCVVCNEWLHLKNFEDWFIEQVVQEEWELDKDLLIKGNKIYSPTTCVFLPREINAFLTSRKNHRGEWPIGVTYHSRIGKWQATCNTNGWTEPYIGVYTSPNEAFLAYKEVKERYAKHLAEKWSGVIDVKAIEALQFYSIDISD